MKKSLMLSSVVAVLLFSGCATKNVEPDMATTHEKLTIAEAEAIVDDRNKQIVLDVDKIARVTAILTKRLQLIEDKINGVSQQEAGIKGAKDDIYLLKKDLADLHSMKAEHDRIKADVDELNRVKDEYLMGLSNKKIETVRDAETVKKEIPPIKKIEKKKPKVYIAPAIEDFDDEEGKVIVKYKTAFTRSSPNKLKSSKATAVKEGEIFNYVAKSENWYKLKSGLYINKMVVCETTLCAGVAKKGEPIGNAKPTPAPLKKTPPPVAEKGIVNQPPVKPTAPLSTAKPRDILKPANKQ